jgi:hypothetical protein
MPFKSKKQWRWAWANRKRWADKWAHKTPSYKGLPESKHSGRKGRRSRR